MNKACVLLAAALVAGIFAVGDAAAQPYPAAPGGGHAGGSKAGWTPEQAGEGRMVPVPRYASWSRAHPRASAPRACGHGYTAYGAAWDYLGWSHIIGDPYYGCGYPSCGHPFFAGGVAGDSLGAPTPGALGTSRYGWW